MGAGSHRAFRQHHRAIRQTCIACFPALVSSSRVELETQGYLSGAGAILPEDGVCQECHRDRTNKLTCASTRWKNHLLEGRVTESVWEDVSNRLAGSTCGW